MSCRVNPKYRKPKSDGFGENISVSFMNKIRYILHTKGMNFTDLALMVGLDKSSMSQYSSGNRNINVKTMGKISEALNLSVSIDIKPRIRAINEP